MKEFGDEPSLSREPSRREGRSEVKGSDSATTLGADMIQHVLIHGGHAVERLRECAQKNDRFHVDSERQGHWERLGQSQGWDEEQRRVFSEADSTVDRRVRQVSRPVKEPSLGGELGVGRERGGARGGRAGGLDRMLRGYLLKGRSCEAEER